MIGNNKPPDEAVQGSEQKSRSSISSSEQKSTYITKNMEHETEPQSKTELTPNFRPSSIKKLRKAARAVGAASILRKSIERKPPSSKRTKLSKREKSSTNLKESLSKYPSSAQSKTVERKLLKLVLKKGYLQLHDQQYDEAKRFFSQTLKMLGIPLSEGIPQVHLPTENQHRIEAMLKEMGVTYDLPELLQEAVTHYEKSLVGNSLIGLGFASFGRDEDDKAYHCFREATRLLLITEASTNYKDYSLVLKSMAIINTRREEMEECISWLREMVLLAKRCFGEGCREEIITRCHLASTLKQHGDFTGALECNHHILEMQVLQVDENENGIGIVMDNHMEISRTLSRIGLLHSIKGDYELSLEFFQRALQNISSKQMTSILPKEQTVKIQKLKAYLWNKMGETNCLLGKKGEAIECYQKNLTFKFLRPQEKILSINNLGSLYYEMGDTTSALSYFEQALTMCERTSNQKIVQENRGGILYNIGYMYYLQHDYTKSQSHFETFVEEQKQNIAFEKMNPEITASVASAYNCLGTCAVLRKDYDQAIIWFQESLTLKKAVLEQSTQKSDKTKALISYDGTLTNLFSSCLTVKKTDEALRQLEDFKRLISGSITSSSSKRAFFISTHIVLRQGTVYVLKRKYDVAMAHYQTAYKMIQRYAKEQKEAMDLFFLVRYNIALLLCKLGQFDEAVIELNDVRQYKRENLPEGHPDIAKIQLDLSCVYFKEQKYEKSKHVCSAALSSFEEAKLPKSHPYIRRAKKMLGQMEHVVVSTGDLTYPEDVDFVSFEEQQTVSTVSEHEIL